MYIERLRYLVRDKKNMSSRNKLSTQNPKNKIQDESNMYVLSAYYLLP